MSHHRVSIYIKKNSERIDEVSDLLYLLKEQTSLILKYAFICQKRERERAGVHHNIGNISVLNHEQKYLPVRYATICVCVCVCLMRDFSFNGRIPS